MTVNEESYNKDFNPLIYLNKRFVIDLSEPQKNNGDRDHVPFIALYIAAISFFATSEFTEKRNIFFSDYGIGPNLSALKSAAFHSSKLILADYAEINLKYLDHL